jgi:hypothetical protein
MDNQAKPVVLMRLLCRFQFNPFVILFPNNVLVGPRKDIGPLLWDLSLAEHLKPGEKYAEVCSKFIFT